MPSILPGKHPVVGELRVEFYRQGLSQEKLAAATGISASAISRRLTYKTSPTLEELDALAHAAGLRLDVALSPEERAS